MFHHKIMVQLYLNSRTLFPLVSVPKLACSITRKLHCQRNNANKRYRSCWVVGISCLYHKVLFLIVMMKHLSDRTTTKEQGIENNLSYKKHWYFPILKLDSIFAVRQQIIIVDVLPKRHSNSVIHDSRKGISIIHQEKQILG